MKKAAIISAAIVVILLIAIVLSASMKTRKLDTDYELSFTGRTAVCKAIVTGENKNDFIQVTMRLKQGATVLQSWYKEGYFQFEMKETYAGLESGKLYTLEISSIINGIQQPVVSAKRTLTGSTAPTTKPSVPPTTAPTTPPTIHPTVPPTTQPTVPPVVKYEGWLFVYDGEQPYISMTLDLSGCTLGHLYWVDEGSTTVIPIVEEEIAPCYNKYLEIYSGHVYDEEDGWIYYVKSAAPTKIYRTCRTDFSKHEMIYESSHGPVVDVGVYDTQENDLQIVADNKQFFVFDMNTGEEILMMEMHYIFSAYVGPGEDETFDNMIFWSGKPTENDRYYLYGYSRVTGEVWEEQ